jgi:uncharacterized protein
MLKQRIEQDLKTALRAGDTTQLNVLRSLKSSITYAEVAKGVKGVEGLDDDEILGVFAKEMKKRQESIDAFTKVGNETRAKAELEEKALIERYLPKALSREELSDLVQETVSQFGAPTPGTLGRIIGEVKRRAGPTADGALVAQLVKERM